MSIAIHYREKNHRVFDELWSILIDAAKVGPRYSLVSLETYRMIASDKGTMNDDKSFVYLVNGQPVAGAFLPIEKNGASQSVSIVGDYVDAPVFVADSVTKEVMRTIDSIATETGVSKVMLSIDPLEHEKVPYNYLQKFGYLDTSILNYMIDLTRQGSLLSECRKGHRNDIKRILDDPDFQVFSIDGSNPNREVHENYRLLHHKCSGRITRPIRTFDLQFEKLKQGQSVLFGLRYKKKEIAFSYFDHLNMKGAYASAADDPDIQGLPLYHVLIYSAMEYLKDRGVRFIDAEQPSGPSLQVDYYPDGKQLNIGHFKTGFGGMFVQNFRGVRYFDAKQFRSDMAEFTEIYAKSIVARLDDSHH